MPIESCRTQCNKKFQADQRSKTKFEVGEGNKAEPETGTTGSGAARSTHNNTQVGDTVGCDS